MLGAERNGFKPEECVCIEDAPTGIRSGKAAGNIVLATCTSHTRESLEKEKPDFLVEDLSHVACHWENGVMYVTSLSLCLNSAVLEAEPPFPLE